MSKENIKALENCIEHWERVKEGKEEALPTNCDLCNMYLLKDSINDCTNCPICKHIKESGCKGTPYFAFLRHYEVEHINFTGTRLKVVCNLCQAYAQDEIDFLEELLEIEKEKEKKYYVKVENPGTAIGEGEIRLIIVDENSKRISSGNLAWISRGGILFRSEAVGGDNPLPIQRDSRGRLKLYDDGC